MVWWLVDSSSGLLLLCRWVSVLVLVELYLVRWWCFMVLVFFGCEYGVVVGGCVVLVGELFFDFGCVVFV